MSEQMITKVLNFEVKEVAARTLEFVGSTEDKDRQGDTIMANGWQLKQYKKNPVFMWAHNYGEPPIGKAVKVWVEDDKLKFHIQFADKETYEFADTIFKLYKGGFLRASSVGFLPLESEPIDKDDEEAFCHSPTRYLKQELLELSGCPVPANPHALAEAKAKGLISSAQELAEMSKGWVIMMEGEGEAIKGPPQKPYPNEHACRLKDPSEFQEDSFRRTQREHEGKTYSIIMGKLKGEDTMTEQAYRYSKNIWNAEEARKHCKEHDGTFEAAKSKEEFTCECIDCGFIVESEEHCKDMKCPKCGGEMRRIERPSSGRELSESEQKIAEDTAETLELAIGQEQIKKGIKDISQAKLGDELAYVGESIESVGLNDENMQLAWELVRTIFTCNETRESGSDIPVDIAEKIGAVLNRANRDKLEKAKTLVQEVLDSAEKPEEEESEPVKEIPRDEVREIIKTTVLEVINDARGKVRR